MSLTMSLCHYVISHPNTLMSWSLCQFVLLCSFPGRESQPNESQPPLVRLPVAALLYTFCLSW